MRKHLHLADISTDTTAFPWSKRTPRTGLESTLAVAFCLILGPLVGHPSAGAIAAGAAFSVGFAAFHEALSSTLLSMGLLTLGIASATLAGSLGAPWTLAVFLLAVVAAINYGLLADLGPVAGWIGQQSGVYVVITSYFPQGTHYALGRTAMVLLGGALQMIVFATDSALRRRFGKNDETPPQKHPFPFRLGQRLGQLSADLSHELDHKSSSTFSYVARLSLTLLLSTAFYRRHHLGNGYWAPMTAMLVAKPQWASTLSRGIARFSGTLVGAGVAVLTALYLPPHLWLFFLLVLVCAWACFALQAVNYALFCCFLTLYTVYSFRIGGFSQPTAAHLRLLNTAVGGGIALLVDGLWTLAARLREGRLHPANSVQ